MSLGYCECPLGSTLPTISDQDCPFKIGLVTRIAFQRSGTGSEFVTASNNIIDEASWDTFLAAVDSTKIQITPRFGGTEVTPSEAIVEGGNDNTTPLGQPIVTGDTIPVFTAQYFNLEPEIKRELRQFICEGDMTGYFIDNNNVIIGWSTDSGATITGIPMSQIYIGSRGLGGITESDKNNFQLNLPINWDEYLYKSTPDGWQPLYKNNS